MFCHMGGRRNWGSLGGGNLQEKYKTPYKRQERVKISGYLARARARARPALVKRGASGPCPKKCLKIFLHRARVHVMPIFRRFFCLIFKVFQNKNSEFCIEALADSGYIIFAVQAPSVFPPSHTVDQVRCLFMVY